MPARAWGFKSPLRHFRRGRRGEARKAENAGQAVVGTVRWALAAEAAQDPLQRVEALFAALRQAELALHQAVWDAVQDYSWREIGPGPGCLVTLEQTPDDISTHWSARSLAERLGIGGHLQGLEGSSLRGEAGRPGGALSQPAAISSASSSSLTGAKSQTSTPTLIMRSRQRHFSWMWP